MKIIEIILALESGKEIEFENQAIWNKEKRTLTIHLDNEKAENTYIVNKPEKVALVKMKGIMKLSD